MDIKFEKLRVSGQDSKFDQIRYESEFFDPLYGRITFYGKALQIIQTSEYQRLKEISQLGGCRYHFHTANHTRFEHCLGVAFLIERLTERLISQDKITVEEQEILVIAGLCHDLGHGPYSHLFDRLYSSDSNHEDRSVLILNSIVKKYDINLSDQDLILIQELITGEKKLSKKKAFFYQIVANQKNGIDLDRMDYLVRDCYYIYGNVFKDDRNSDNLKQMFFKILDSITVHKKSLCYSDEYVPEIYDFYRIRMKRYSDVYFNQNVQAIELMISDILKYLKLENNDIQDFLKYNDHLIGSLSFLKKPVNAKKLANRIIEGNYYELVHESITSKKIDKNKVISFILEKEEKFEKQFEVLSFKIGDDLKVRSRNIWVYNDTKVYHPEFTDNLGIKYYLRVYSKSKTSDKLKDICQLPEFSSCLLV